MSLLLSQCPQPDTFRVPLPPPPTLLSAGEKDRVQSERDGFPKGWFIRGNPEWRGDMANLPQKHHWHLDKWAPIYLNSVCGGRSQHKRATHSRVWREGSSPPIHPLLLLPGATEAKDRRSGGKTGAIKREKQDEEWEVGERWLRERERVGREKRKPESSHCMRVTLVRVPRSTAWAL